MTLSAFLRLIVREGTSSSREARNNLRNNYRFVVDGELILRRWKLDIIERKKGKGRKERRGLEEERR
jgi:hypothetical protein